MTEYILYCFDGLKFVRCERFMAESDDAAIAEALRLQGGDAAELWCGPRKVKVFTAINPTWVPPTPGASPPS